MNPLPYSATPQIPTGSTHSTAFTVRAFDGVHIERDFWTWPEALIVAHKVAQQSMTRPRIRRRGDRWHVAYDVKPVPYNTKVAS